MNQKTKDKIEAMADNQFEKQFYENGQQGFMSKPYSNYRYHNGHVDGQTHWAEWCERFEAKIIEVSEGAPHKTYTEIFSLLKEYREWLEDIDG